MTPTRTDTICDTAIELSRNAGTPGTSPEAAADRLVVAADGDRAALEAARDRLAVRLRINQADFEATGALTLLNRALAAYGWIEPFDWKRRWAQHRKP